MSFTLVYCLDLKNKQKFFKISCPRETNHTSLELYKYFCLQIPYFILCEPSIEVGEKKHLKSQYSSTGFIFSTK